MPAAPFLADSFPPGPVTPLPGPGTISSRSRR